MKRIEVRDGWHFQVSKFGVVAYLYQPDGKTNYGEWPTEKAREFAAALAPAVTPTADSVSREIFTCLGHKVDDEVDELFLSKTTAIIQRALEASAHLAAAPGVGPASGVLYIAEKYDGRGVLNVSSEVSEHLNRMAKELKWLHKQALTAPAQPDTLIRELQKLSRSAHAVMLETPLLTPEGRKLVEFTGYAAQTCDAALASLAAAPGKREGV